MRKYGRTYEEAATYASENFEAYGKGVLTTLEGQGLSGKAAIDKLADINCMSTKNIERLVTIGKKIEELEEGGYEKLADVNSLFS